jgi:hypothetical protein
VRLVAIASAATVAAVSTTATSAATTTAESAAATTTTASATVSATTATATAGTILARTGFIDGERPAAVVLTVQRCDRRLRFFVSSHFDETETLASTGVAIINDLRRDDLAVLAKQLFQLRAIDLIAQVADVQLLTHCRSP